MKLQREQGREAFPTFKEFVQEVRYHAQRMNIPQLSYHAEDPKDLRKTPTGPKSFRRFMRRSPLPPLTTTLATSSTPKSEPTEDKLSSSKDSVQVRKHCFYHNVNSHATHECEQFSKLSYNERKELLRAKNVCFNCLVSDKHVARKCDQQKLECTICHGKHATILHDPTRQETGHSAPQPAANTSNSACSQVCGDQQSIYCARIALVQVFHQDKPESRLSTYAVLDDQSTDVFVTLC